MPLTLTDEFISHLSELSQIDIPSSVRHQAKRCLLDYLGVTFAGSRLLREKGTRLLDRAAGTHSSCTAIGFGRKTSLQTAILVNGLSSHVAELDDGERFGMLHPGAPVLSALLPVAEHERISGTELLRGVVLGYEAAIRLASALQPRMKDRGYHATGTCGTLGAAVGVGTVLGFSRQELKDTLSAAVTTASGMLRVIRDSSELKPYNVAQAARNGWQSAMVAQAGFAGPNDVLDGDDGFLKMMAGSYDRQRLLAKRDRDYAIEGVYVKPYAACRHCHPAIEAVLKLRARHQFDPQAISEINIATYRWAVHLHDHTTVHGVASAKMSTPGSVAVALCTGRAGISEFTPEIIHDPTVSALMQKVNVRSDDQLTVLVPDRRPAIVEIRMQDGQAFSERVDLPKGEPENPLSDEEMQEKFVALATYGGRSPREAAEIVAHVWNVEDQRNTLLSLL